MCMPVFPLMLMHLNAARGNEENGYMISGNHAGLYYNSQAQYEQRMREREAEEAKNRRNLNLPHSSNRICMMQNMGKERHRII